MSIYLKTVDLYGLTRALISYLELVNLINKSSFVVSIQKDEKSTFYMIFLAKEICKYLCYEVFEQLSKLCLPFYFPFSSSCRKQTVKMLQ